MAIVRFLKANDLHRNHLIKRIVALIAVLALRE